MPLLREGAPPCAPLLPVKKHAIAAGGCGSLSRRSFSEGGRAHRHARRNARKGAAPCHAVAFSEGGRAHRHARRNARKDAAPCHAVAFSEGGRLRRQARGNARKDAPPSDRASRPWPPLLPRERGSARSRTIKSYLSCIKTFPKSSKFIKKVAYAMATHFCPKEALHLLGGGRGWFPHKVKERNGGDVVVFGFTSLATFLSDRASFFSFCIACFQTGVTL